MTLSTGRGIHVTTMVSLYVHIYVFVSVCLHLREGGYVMVLLDGQFPVSLLLVTPLGLLLSMASPDCHDTCMNRITG